jgi:hypothetical protein
MRSRHFTFVSLERFLVVEQYWQSHQPPAARPLRGGMDRTGDHAGRPGTSSGPRAAARDHHG